jgi:hypothetical protein
MKARQISNPIGILFNLHRGHIIHELGELTALLSIDLIKAAERNNAVTCLKDAIEWDLIEQDDITGLLSRYVMHTLNCLHYTTELLLSDTAMG